MHECPGLLHCCSSLAVRVGRELVSSRHAVPSIRVDFRGSGWIQDLQPRAVGLSVGRRVPNEQVERHAEPTEGEQYPG